MVTDIFLALVFFPRDCQQRRNAKLTAILMHTNFFSCVEFVSLLICLENEAPKSKSEISSISCKILKIQKFSSYLDSEKLSSRVYYGLLSPWFATHFSSCSCIHPRKRLSLEVFVWFVLHIMDMRKAMRRGPFVCSCNCWLKTIVEMNCRKMSVCWLVYDSVSSTQPGCFWWTTTQ